MDEMAKRASAVRGSPAEAKASPDVPGIAPVKVPRKQPDPESPAMKALAEKKAEIDAKISKGPAASASMGVATPSKAAASAPSIKERYTTPGSAPTASKPAPIVAAASPSKPATAAKPAAKAAPATKPAAAAPSTPDLAQALAPAKQALQDAMGGKVVHIHVHAPVNITIESPSSSKL